MTQFGGDFFKTKALNGGQWGLCIALGAFSIPWQVVVNVAVRMCNVSRHGRRSKLPPRLPADKVHPVCVDPHLHSPGLRSARRASPTACVTQLAFTPQVCVTCHAAEPAPKLHPLR